MQSPSHVAFGFDLQENAWVLLRSKVGEAGEEERTSTEHLGKGTEVSTDCLALVCVLTANYVLRGKVK